MPKYQSGCLFIHRTAVVMADGAVASCANMFAETVGRLDQAGSFLDVWNGERLVSVRASLGTEDEWAQCGTCWFREIRYDAQREAWSSHDRFRLEDGSDYAPESWDFRRYRSDG